jgi:hypothetical protein
MLRPSVRNSRSQPLPAWSTNGWPRLGEGAGQIDVSGSLICRSICRDDSCLHSKARLKGSGTMAGGALPSQSVCSGPMKLPSGTCNASVHSEVMWIVVLCGCYPLNFTRGPKVPALWGEEIRCIEILLQRAKSLGEISCVITGPLHILL